MPKRRIHKDDVEEDVLVDKSAYGEFVSTFHHWTDLEGNHKRGEELAKVGKTNNKNKKKGPFSVETKEE